MSTLPAGEPCSDALGGVVSSMAIRDPYKAVSIMDSYPSDVDYGVVRNFIWHSFGNDPALAVNQITRIADAGEREQMYRRTLSRWNERDAAAANAWMQANPLPPTVQQQLQRRFGAQQQ